MTTIPACPPIPTLQELQSNKFVQVDVNELVPNEFVIRRFGENIACIEIISNTNDPNGYIKLRYSEDNEVESLKPYIPNGTQFYRRVNPRKNFDEFSKKMNARITEYPMDKPVTKFEQIIGNRGLSDNIGQFLGPTISRKGGRRKTKRTRRTQKNKRKTRKHRKSRRF